MTREEMNLCMNLVNSRAGRDGVASVPVGDGYFRFDVMWEGRNDWITYDSYDALCSDFETRGPVMDAPAMNSGTEEPEPEPEVTARVSKRAARPRSRATSKKTG